MKTRRSTRGRPQGAYTYGEPLTTGIDIRLFARQLAALQRIAGARNVGVTYLVREAVEAWLRQQPPAQP